MQSTGKIWNYSPQVISVTPNTTGKITDMDNPFPFLLSLEASSDDSKISSTFFVAKLKTHVCLRIKELTLNITSKWMNRNTTK